MESEGREGSGGPGVGLGSRMLRGGDGGGVAGLPASIRTGGLCRGSILRETLVHFPQNGLYAAGPSQGRRSNPVGAKKRPGGPHRTHAAGSCLSL